MQRALLVTLFILAAYAAAFAVPQQINYQGHLTSPTGSPLDTTVSMTFKLYADSAAGTLLWTEPRASVAVTQGSFTVHLGEIAALTDALFSQNQLWLGVTVGNNSEMAPRVRVLSTAYSYRVGTVDSASGGTINGDLNVVGEANIGYSNASSGTGAFVAGDRDSVAGNWSVISGGYRNLALDTASTVSGGASNSANGRYSAVGGGRNNHVRGAYSVIAGGGGYNAADSNSISSGSNGGTIAGGKHQYVSSNYGGTIGGGHTNTVSGGYATIGGGHANTASTSFATVPGGEWNTASGIFSIASGDSGVASGAWSCVPGGFDNTAAGNFSLAAGFEAQANHTGSFVWADSSMGSFASTGSNQFLIRANGGVGINTNAPDAPLTVAGIIHSASGGIKFPDGSTQTTAASGNSSGQQFADTSTWDATRTWVKSMGYLGGSNNVISATGFVGGGDCNKARGSYSVVSGGGGSASSDSNSAIGDNSVIAGGLRNTTSNSDATVSGGLSNTAGGWSSTVSGGAYNTASAWTSTVGGGQSNLATGVYATISGGLGNQANGTNAVIGGGSSNSTSTDNTTISGGASNSANSNTASGSEAAIGGGGFNTASNMSSVVGGGSENRAEGVAATASGGNSNYAAGDVSMIPGGEFNVTRGMAAFAAGNSAHANHHGSFVWGDISTSDSVYSTDWNQWVVRATGGFRFYTNTSLSAGVTLAPNASSWSSVSDSTKKRNIRLTDTRRVLEKMAALPIKDWEYKAEDAGIEHTGPMAQDFWNAFHLGSDSLGIATIDADGVMMAAIQELARRVEALEKENAHLHTLIDSQASAPAAAKPYLQEN